MRKAICNKCGNFKQEGKKCNCKPSKINNRNNKVYDTKGDVVHTRFWKESKRPQIINRDGGICQRCLIKYNRINNERLQVHHIKSRKEYPHLALDDDNLICVCQQCNLTLGTSNKLDFDWSNDDKDREIIL